MTQLHNPDSWRRLAQYTRARIALGRVGVSQSTADVLSFLEAHAHARDAVHAPLDRQTLAEAFRQAGFDSVSVRSRAASRTEFLLRPDLGRRLDASSAARISEMRALPAAERRLALVAADGLSSLAVMRYALPLALALRARLPGWQIRHVVIAEQARVALGDEIGELCSAAVTLALIGERPGLQSAESLGAYLTYGPQVGRTDAERSCISNIHDDGYPAEEAAHAIAALLTDALALKATGIALKARQSSTEHRLMPDSRLQ